MTTKLTVIYDAPRNWEAFEALYDDQLTLASSIPGLKGVETRRVWPTGQKSPQLAYRLVELFFNDPPALRHAMSTEEAWVFLPSIFKVGASGVHIDYHEGS